MREIHYYVHGRGRGHAMRALDLVPKLEAKGYQVALFTGKTAREALEAHHRCYPIRSLLPGEPFLTAPKLLQRTLWAGTRGLRRAPIAVLSDGDLPSSVASCAVGVKVIAIGHGLVFSQGVAPTAIDRMAWAREAGKARRASFGADYRVAVSFVPLTLTGDSSLLARTARPHLKRLPHRQGGIVAYFRDQNAAPVLEALRSVGISPRLFSPVDPQLPGVMWERPNRQRFLEALANADAVVSSAGHQLISECLELGVPHLTLYARGDDEQYLNAELLRLSGLGESLAFENVDRARVLYFLARLPELEHARKNREQFRELPKLDSVVLQLLERIEDSQSRCSAGAGS